ncbi:carboxy terminal-processing peptidase [Glaesserella parasuis]|uniref:S41 family carboxy-terminal protease/periplasmic protease n=1 Tax=Glaesserella parasuis serovar 5 (strain SH0165) TaxID=557723 RepID=B8F8P4_GLAP5|nr:carboxy terminal-processing peptidase [Glaesserella parasuis]ACL33696.1 S41 family carboxy-terminal protease/periplasmic protease [Glaesserella parasuis SH0165]MCT8764101.1 carboxy terminal-processing peptidase [Glaesserella parasuis]MCT8769407.1 carboxy terminal-processing peptidase [Glaesserella parasuis]MDE3964451.1 carboxy terminal-processing peptidase [Glaesserella parasuis]MDG6267373.1 carboxy terminal-processing peptidase [Glaesserella parasuis]
MKYNKFTTLLGLCLGVCSINSFAAEPQIKESELIIPKPTEQHSISTKRVTARLTQSHYHKFQLDDAFSEKIFNRYIDWLDGSHNTFLQSDIDELRAKYATKLDEELYEGKLDIAFEMYELMTKRRYERYKYALSLLDKEPDLKGQDQIENDREKAPFPKTTTEADELWLQRVKNDIINLYLKDKKWPEIKKTLTKRYNLAIRRLTQNKADDILQTYLNAFAREIDPHTSYLSPRAAKRFQESMNLSLEGIGATLSMEDDITIIKSLVPGAPAARSKKIAAGDKIVGVGQSKDKIEDVIGWRLDDVVDNIKGKKGSTVYLEIEPAKGGKTKIISLVRDKIRLEDSAAKLTVDKVDGKNIAVIKIPSFYIGLTADVRKLLEQMKTKKADGLIIDLRENGGGSLPEVVELTGLFIKDGPVVQVRDAFNRIRVHEDTDSTTLYDGNILVMINRHSASASEIFAAAMQDYNRAIIIGQQSFGKGTVQQNRSLNMVYDLDQEPLGFIQYTIQKFYRINGGSTQIKGVEADIRFPEIINAEKTGEGFEDNALPWDKIPAATYSEVAKARDVVAQLTENHEKRIAKNPEFIALNETIAINKERDDRKFTSLNLASRQEESKADEARRLKDLNARFKREGKKQIKDLEQLPKDYEAPDFFLKETEQMMVDWLQFDKK